MKRIRQLTVLAVILCLLCALWVPAVSAATAEAPATAPVAKSVANPLEAPLDLLEDLPNGDKLCAVYLQILESLEQGEEYVYFANGYTLSHQEQIILEAVVNATIPESYGNNVGHSYASVGENYFHKWFYDWGLTQEMTEAVDARVAELTADLEGKSDFDKSRILYERLVNINYYDMGVYHQTAYGALIDETSVCAGYARAYQLLLQAVGIPCLYIHGNADNGWEIGAHAWNLVRLDGKWYYADPTWDDSDSDDFPLSYAYFNITYDEISVDHFAAEEFAAWLPTEPAIEANYYYHEGFVCDSLTVQEMADLFLQQNPVILYVTGDRQEVINFFFDHAYEITEAMGLYSFGYISGMLAGSHGVALMIEYNHVHEDTGGDGYCDYCHGPIRPKTTRGDLDGNGKVNNRDVGLLQQYVNEWDVTIDTAAADVNGDGRINNRDLGLLLRQINEI